MCMHIPPLYMLFLTAFSGILLCAKGTFGFEEDVELVDFSVLHQQSVGAVTTSSGNIKEGIEFDLGSCSIQTKIPCIESETCETIPALEPLRCRRRYCPQNKVYCLDFDGCMIPDPVFIFSLAVKEKKCPIPLSLCANKEQCQYVLRKNYDDLREPSLNRLNCSLMTQQIVFNNSSCKVHSDCHWTSKCCADGGFNRQCVSYNRTVLPARMLNGVNSSCPNCSTSSTISSTPSISTNAPTVQLQTSLLNMTVATAPTTFSTVKLQSSTSLAKSTSHIAPTPFPSGQHPQSTSLPTTTNVTKLITIRIMNNYSTIVEGSELEFQSHILNQLVSLLAVPKEAFTKIIARNGSILLDVEMTSSLNITAAEIDRAYTLLVSMLNNGSLALTDFNGTRLNIPSQTNGEISSSETKTYTTIIISVTAASLGTTLLLILWILWNNKNNKAIIPVAAHLDRMNSHNMFRSKLSVDNLIDNNRETSNDHFSTFADPQVQWEIFQKSFNKPGYVWQSQDEAVWAGVDHQVQWPQLDAPDDESVPVSSYKHQTNKENAHN